MAKTPVLDLGRCTECEACLELCPTVFVRNEAGYIEVTSLPEYPEDCVDEVISCCPAGCVSWDESA